MMPKPQKGIKKRLMNKIRSLFSCTSKSHPRKGQRNETSSNPAPTQDVMTEKTANIRRTQTAKQPSRGHGIRFSRRAVQRSKYLREKFGVRKTVMGFSPRVGSISEEDENEIALLRLADNAENVISDGLAWLKDDSKRSNCDDDDDDYDDQKILLMWIENNSFDTMGDSNSSCNDPGDSENKHAESHVLSALGNRENQRDEDDGINSGQKSKVLRLDNASDITIDDTKDACDVCDYQNDSNSVNDNGCDLDLAGDDNNSDCDSDNDYDLDKDNCDSESDFTKDHDCERVDEDDSDSDNDSDSCSDRPINSDCHNEMGLCNENMSDNSTKNYDQIIESEDDNNDVSKKEMVCLTSENAKGKTKIALHDDESSTTSKLNSTERRLERASESFFLTDYSQYDDDDDDYIWVKNDVIRDATDNDVTTVDYTFRSSYKTKTEITSGDDTVRNMDQHINNVSSLAENPPRDILRAAPERGLTISRRGMITSQRGMMTSQSCMITSQRDIMTSQRGMRKGGKGNLVGMASELFVNRVKTPQPEEGENKKHSKRENGKESYLNDIINSVEEEIDVVWTRISTLESDFHSARSIMNRLKTSKIN